jgi:hypothetical protein
MWLVDVSFDGERFLATLGNEPVYGSGLHLGDQLTIEPQDVSDWIMVIWLSLKTVARSPRWTQEKRIKGRGLPDNLLIGNGLSILLSFTGVALAVLLARSLWQHSLCVAAVLFASSVTPLSVITCAWLYDLLEKRWGTLATKVDPHVYWRIRGKAQPSVKQSAPA